MEDDQELKLGPRETWTPGLLAFFAANEMCELWDAVLDTSPQIEYIRDVFGAFFKDGPFASRDCDELVDGFMSQMDSEGSTGKNAIVAIWVGTALCAAAIKADSAGDTQLAWTYVIDATRFASDLSTTYWDRKKRRNERASKAGKVSGHQRKQAAQAVHSLWKDKANRLLRNGRAAREIASIIANGDKNKARHIRSVLQDEGVLSKRKTEVS